MSGVLGKPCNGGQKHKLVYTTIDMHSQEVVTVIPGTTDSHCPLVMVWETQKLLKQAKSQREQVKCLGIQVRDSISMSAELMAGPQNTHTNILLSSWVQWHTP